MNKNCSTCKHNPVDEHCKGHRGEKDGNMHLELEELDFSTPKKVVGNLISVNVLDKIRSEIGKFAENPNFGDLSLGARCGAIKAIEIIDKYRKEQE